VASGLYLRWVSQVVVCCGCSSLVLDGCCYTDFLCSSTSSYCIPVVYALVTDRLIWPGVVCRI